MFSFSSVAQEQDENSKDEATESMEDLYKLSTSYRDGTMAPKIDKARKAMIDMGTKALDFIFKDKFFNMSNLEWRGVQTIIDGIGKPSVPYLLKELDHENPGVRRFAVVFLGRLKPAEITSG